MGVATEESIGALRLELAQVQSDVKTILQILTAVFEIDQSLSSTDQNNDYMAATDTQTLENNLQAVVTSNSVVVANNVEVEDGSDEPLEVITYYGTKDQVFDKGNKQQRAKKRKANSGHESHSSLFQSATKSSANKTGWKCAVVGCYRNSGSQNVSFHRIPTTDVALRKKWLEAIRPEEPTWNPGIGSRICARHFRPADLSNNGNHVFVKSGVVPCLFPHNNFAIDCDSIITANVDEFVDKMMAETAGENSPASSVVSALNTPSLSIGEADAVQKQRKKFSGRVTGKGCCIPGCTSRTIDKLTGERVPISLHRFPKDPEQRKHWIDVTNRADFVPSDSTRVCSKHFEEKFLVRNPNSEGFRLIDDRSVVPTLFLPKENNSGAVSKKEATGGASDESYSSTMNGDSGGSFSVAYVPQNNANEDNVKIGFDTTDDMDFSMDELGNIASTSVVKEERGAEDELYFYIQQDLIEIQRATQSFTKVQGMVKEEDATSSNAIHDNSIGMVLRQATAVELPSPSVSAKQHRPKDLREKKARCAVQGCRNSKPSTVDLNVTYHRIPMSNQPLRKKWLIAIRPNDPSWDPCDTTRICSLHFAPEDVDPLKRTIVGQGVVPSIFDERVLTTPIKQESSPRKKAKTASASVTSESEEKQPELLKIKRARNSANDRYYHKTCCVAGCVSVSDKTVSFHKFPKDEVRKQLWIDAVGPLESGLKDPRICSKHFVPEHLLLPAATGKHVTRLTADAFPALNFSQMTALMSDVTPSMNFATRADVQNLAREIDVMKNDLRSVLELSHLILIAVHRQSPVPTAAVNCLPSRSSLTSFSSGSSQDKNPPNNAVDQGSEPQLSDSKSEPVINSAHNRVDVSNRVRPPCVLTALRRNTSTTILQNRRCSPRLLPPPLSSAENSMPEGNGTQQEQVAQGLKHVPEPDLKHVVQEKEYQQVEQCCTTTDGSVTSSVEVQERLSSTASSSKRKTKSRKKYRKKFASAIEQTVKSVISMVTNGDHDLVVDSVTSVAADMHAAASTLKDINPGKTGTKPIQSTSVFNTAPIADAKEGGGGEQRVVSFDVVQEQQCQSAITVEDISDVDEIVEEVEIEDVTVLSSAENDKENLMDFVSCLNDDKVLPNYEVFQADSSTAEAETNTSNAVETNSAMPDEVTADQMCLLREFKILLNRDPYIEKLMSLPPKPLCTDSVDNSAMVNHRSLTTAGQSSSQRNEQRKSDRKLSVRILSPKEATKAATAAKTAPKLRSSPRRNKFNQSRSGSSRDNIRKLSATSLLDNSSQSSSTMDLVHALIIDIPDSSDSSPSLTENNSHSITEGPAVSFDASTSVDVPTGIPTSTGISRKDSLSSGSSSNTTSSTEAAVASALEKLVSETVHFFNNNDSNGNANNNLPFSIDKAMSATYCEETGVCRLDETIDEFVNNINAMQESLGNIPKPLELNAPTTVTTQNKAHPKRKPESTTAKAPPFLKCAVVGCNSNSASVTFVDGKPSFSLHNFPDIGSTQRIEWAKAVRLGKRDFTPDSNSRICSNHFDTSLLIYKEKEKRYALSYNLDNVVPTLLLYHNVASQFGHLSPC